MNNTTTAISLDIHQHTTIICALLNRVSKLFSMRHDVFGKLDKQYAENIKSTIKLIRLARKSHKVQFSM
jgi:hypothetical protein